MVILKHIAIIELQDRIIKLLHTQIHLHANPHRSTPKVIYDNNILLMDLKLQLKELQRIEK